MKHHLTDSDAAWIESQGEFAISGRSETGNRNLSKWREAEMRIDLIHKAQRFFGSVSAAASYFDVSTSTWRAWRCGDRIAPPTVCSRIEKMLNMKFLSPTEVARMFNVSVHTLRHWRSEGKGPPAVKIGSQWRYDESRLMEFIHSCHTPHKPRT